MSDSGWIAVDLDGTLAEYTTWGTGEIGAPIPLMVERVKNWLEEGKTVKIFTARVGPQSDPQLRDLQRLMVETWCIIHLGHPLEVTATKDFHMEVLYDDRCRQVETNTGRLLG